MKKHALKRPLETEIHQQIVFYLNAVLPAGAVLHHSPNEMRAHVGWHMKLKKMGFKKGFPDLMVIAPKEAFISPADAAPIFFEVKSREGRLTAAQRDVLEALEACGSYVATIRSVEDAKEHIRAILSLGPTTPKTKLAEAIGGLP